MERNLVILMVVCVLFVGCSKPATAPSAQQIEAALTKVLKRDAPDAAAKITKLEPAGKDQGVINVDFSCTACPVESATAGLTILPSGKGSAVVAMEVRNNKWVLLSINSCAPDDFVNCKFYHIHEYF